MLIKAIKIFLFLSAIYLLQFGFVSGLAFPFNKINLFISILIFFLVLFDEQIVMIYSVIFSVFSLSYSSMPIFPAIFVLPLTVFATIKIYNTFFTNRSLYSLVFLSAIFWAILTAVKVIFFLLYNFYLHKTLLGAFDWGSFYQGAIWEIILSIVSIIIGFGLINIFSNKLKTVFIASDT